MMKQTKEDFALARSALNMTTTQLAKALRMGTGSDRTIRRYESVECPVPGPTSVAVEALLSGFRPEGFQEN
jgi:hypothetical protein